MTDIKGGERRGSNSPVIMLGEYVSLRDWFAGMALSGMMADASNMSPDVRSNDNLAKIAYRIADAMLSARGEK